MGASYWARWACNGQVTDLPELILPHLLKEGYELLSHDEYRQELDRGGVMKKIAWSLNGGQWSEAPLDLAITYSYSPTQTIANFYWKLAVRPMPVSDKERASFETQIQLQLDRIITRINEQLLDQPAEPIAEAAQEGASLQAYWEHAQESPESESTSIGHEATVATVRHPWPSRTSLQSATAYIDEATRCDVCHRLAVPLPGASNRYFCLACRHHLPCQATAC